MLMGQWSKAMAQMTGVQSPGRLISKIQKLYLMIPSLTLSIIRCRSNVK